MSFIIFFIQPDSKIDKNQIKIIFFVNVVKIFKIVIAHIIVVMYEQSKDTCYIEIESSVRVYIYIYIYMAITSSTMNHILQGFCNRLKSKKNLQFNLSHCFV
jgi:hypothetical protein